MKIHLRVCKWVYMSVCGMHMCVRCVCLGQRSPSGVHLLPALDTRWSQGPGHHTTMQATTVSLAPVVKVADQLSALAP